MKKLFLKKINKLFLLIPIFTLCSCDEEFKPFDFYSLNIINEQESRYISSSSSDNFSNVSNIEKYETYKKDERKVYKGALSKYAECKNIEIKEKINIYKNHSYESSYYEKNKAGNGLDGSFYYTVDKESQIWTDFDTSDISKVNIYKTEQTNYSSLGKSCISSQTYFSSRVDWEINWNKKIRELCNDGYSYDDFSYGTSNGKFYGYFQVVNESVITNPLHPDDIDKKIIVFNEKMYVRSFKKDNELGWVVDYFAEKNNVYHVTSITGDIYDEPLLVEKNETIIKYSYQNRKNKIFEYVENEIYHTPKLFLLTFDKLTSDLATIYESNQLSFKIMPNYSSNSNTIFLLSEISLSKDKFYTFKLSNEENEMILDYTKLKNNDLNYLKEKNINNISTFTPYDDCTLLFIFECDSSGNINSFDSTYLKGVTK